MGSFPTAGLFDGFSLLDCATSRVRFAGVMRGKGQPVLLLHGYPQTHATWHAVAPALAARFAVVMVASPASILLIPDASSVAHRRENLSAANLISRTRRSPRSMASRQTSACPTEPNHAVYFGSFGVGIAPGCAVLGPSASDRHTRRSGYMAAARSPPTSEHDSARTTSASRRAGPLISTSRNGQFLCRYRDRCHH
jgi:hypothetical protein